MGDLARPLKIWYTTRKPRIIRGFWHSQRLNTGAPAKPL